MKNADEGFTYAVKGGNPYCLGVTTDGRQVNFAIAVPDKKSCSLLLYRKGREEAEASIPISTSTRYGDVRAILIEELPADQYEYTYRIDGEEVLDPYAKLFSGRRSWGQKGMEPVRCEILVDPFDWGADRLLEIPFESCVMYAAHVRGFTMHPSSGVLHKGTFLGIQERIPYLKELGINQLELMPVYEFDELTKPLNYWGYGPGFYFAPKSAYAATDDPVRELKSLVKALHQNGIELILEFYFPKHTNPNLILDCIRYWVLEYHIDGVHISGCGVPVSVLALDPMLSRVKIYCGGVSMDDIYSREYEPSFRRLAEYHPGFQNTARRLLRGDEGQIPAFAELVRRNSKKSGVVNYISSHDGFTLTDLVSYEEKHNEANGEDNQDGTNHNFSWNCGAEGPGSSPELQKLRLRQMKNGLAMVFLSQGVPLILSGDECGNSQQGNNNPYCQDNEIGWVCWENGEQGQRIASFVKRLITFRMAHPVFRQRQPLQGVDYLCCGFPDLSFHGKKAWYGSFEHSSRSLGMMYAGTYVAANSGGDEKDDVMYVAYNLHGTSREFALPTLPGDKKWHVALHTGREENDGFYEAGQEIQLKEQKRMAVEAHSIVVLTGK